MNAVNGVTKVMVCGAAALALTVASSWTFVESTATASYVPDLPTIVVVAKMEAGAMQLAQAATTGLLQ
jgi:hypothetical protein